MGTHQTHIFSESTRRVDSEYIYIYGLILKKSHVASCGLANSTFAKIPINLNNILVNFEILYLIIVSTSAFFEMLD